MTTFTLQDMAEFTELPEEQIVSVLGQKDEYTDEDLALLQRPAATQPRTQSARPGAQGFNKGIQTKLQTKNGEQPKSSLDTEAAKAAVGQTAILKAAQKYLSTASMEQQVLAELNDCDARGVLSDNPLLAQIQLAARKQEAEFWKEAQSDFFTESIDPETGESVVTINVPPVSLTPDEMGNFLEEALTGVTPFTRALQSAKDMNLALPASIQP